MRKFIVPALAALSLAVSANPASAGAATAEVRFADLDLSTTEGMAVLDRRVDRAIERVCPHVSGPLYKVEAQKRCVERAKSSANEQIARISSGNTVIAINR